MKKALLLIIAFLLALPLFAQEEDATPEQIKNSNCQILIHTERFTGNKNDQTIYTTAGSKTECEKKAKPHRHNFYPKEIKSKTVEVKFQAKN